MTIENGTTGTKVALERCSSLHLLLNTPKGRGVFTSHTIPAGTILDVCPVLILEPKENVEHIEKTSLYHYTYNWPLPKPDGKPGGKTQAVVLGLGSMFNHSREDQNVGWQRDVERQLVTYRALRDIRTGEELCISYGDHLTFVDTDQPSTIDDAEEAEEVLGRILID